MAGRVHGRQEIRHSRTQRHQPGPQLGVELNLHLQQSQRGSSLAALRFGKIFARFSANKYIISWWIIGIPTFVWTSWINGKLFLFLYFLMGVSCRTETVQTEKIKTETFQTQKLKQKPFKRKNENWNLFKWKNLNRNRSNRKIKTETVQTENFKESVQTKKLKQKPFKWKNLNRSRSNGKIKTETVQTEKLIQKPFKRKN